MAFSRSETEDRRQWPWAPPSHLSALHPITLHPVPAPVLPRTWSTTTQTPQTQHQWAQERRGTWKEQRRRGRDTRRWLPRSPQPFSIPTPPRTSCHTSTWDALEWVTVGWSLGTKAVSENTHELCGWISNVVFVSLYGLGQFCFVLSCLCWDFRQRYVLHLLWSLEELTDRQVIEAKRNIVLVKQRVWRLIVLGERFEWFLLVLHRLLCSDSVTPGPSFIIV